MVQHEIEIRIAPNGKVKVHVKGVKGKGCLEYAKWLTKVLGRVENQQLTSEYYEPETKTKINLQQELKSHE